jgi:Tectonin domain
VLVLIYEHWRTGYIGDDAPLDTPPTAQVWGLNVRPRNPGDLFTFHDIFRFDLASGLFNQIPGELMIIAASAGDVWGINAFHNVFRFDPQARNFTGAFVQVPGQQLDAIAVGTNDVCGLSASQPPLH